MSANTPNVQLPLLVPSQAMKHVTHNEALVRLDAVTQLVLQETGATMPPADPQEGNCYALGTAAQEAWSGQDNQIAVFSNNGWVFVDPQEGWRAWDFSSGELLAYSGGSWSVLQNYNQLEGVGINATHDMVNRLSVSAHATLFNHEGSDHQMKINKAGTDNTASLLFQSGFAGHAELGLAGDNDLSFKVSTDGSNFTTALRARASDGVIDVPCLRSGRIEVGLDAVVEIPTPGTGGLVALSLVNVSSPQASHSGLFSYDSGSTLELDALAAGSGIVTQGSTELTGTTGTSGRTNLSVRPGVLQIENRHEAGSFYSYTFMNTY